MANIDALHTGNSGIEPTFGNEDTSTEQQEAVSEQQRQLAELLPGVQHIIDACDEEIEAVSDIRSYISQEMKAFSGKSASTVKDKYEALMHEYHARELYISYIQRLKTTIAERVHTAEAEVNK
jgi:hypothetical protein